MGAAVDALRTGGKREKIHDTQMVFKLPKTAKALVKEVADKQGVSEGAIARDALAEYFEAPGLPVLTDQFYRATPDHHPRQSEGITP